MREVRRADEAVVSPESRSISHAFAWSLVILASNATRTSAPIRTSSSTARRCVVPIYVVVITRTRPPRLITPSSALRRRTTPIPITNARSRSTESADSSSSRSSLPMVGWPSALTSRSLIDSGNDGAGIVAGLSPSRSGGRRSPRQTSGGSAISSPPSAAERVRTSFDVAACVPHHVRHRARVESPRRDAVTAPAALRRRRAPRDPQAPDRFARARGPAPR